MKVNVTLRIDKNLKKDAEQLFSNLGLELNTAIELFLQESIREKQIPFHTDRDVPNKTTLAAMDDTEKGRDLYGPYDNTSKLMKALDTYTAHGH